MILEGINDIGTLASTTTATPITKDDLIWVLQQVIDRAHAHGIKVIGCTLTLRRCWLLPRNGEAIRSAVNQWIRTSGRSMRSSTLKRPPRDASNPKRLNRNSILATICIRMTSAIRQWRRLSICRFSDPRNKNLWNNASKTVEQAGQ
jgi:hypothetical protein